SLMRPQPQKWRAARGGGGRRLVPQGAGGSIGARGRLRLDAVEALQVAGQALRRTLGPRRLRAQSRHPRFERRQTVARLGEARHPRPGLVERDLRAAGFLTRSLEVLSELFGRLDDLARPLPVLDLVQLAAELRGLLGRTLIVL